MGLDAFELLSRGPCGGHTQIWDLGEARAGLSSLEPWEALRGTYTEEGHVMVYICKGSAPAVGERMGEVG